MIRIILWVVIYGGVMFVAIGRGGAFNVGTKMDRGTSVLITLCFT